MLDCPVDWSTTAQRRWTLILACMALLLNSYNLIRGYINWNKPTEYRQQGPVVYPKGWPLPELTAPPGSEKAQSYLPSAVMSRSPVAYEEHEGRRTWQLGFHTEQGETEVLAHVEAILNPSGYTVKPDTNGPIAEWWFFAPDGLTEVRLLHQPYLRVWWLEINSLPAPAPDESAGATLIP